MAENNHSRFEELIEDYIDGSLSASDKAFFEEHLSQCDEYREKYEAMKFMLDECSELDEETPDGFTDFIMNGIELEKKRKNAFKLAFIRPLIGAAACFVLVAVGYFILTGGMGRYGAKSADSAATESAETKAMVSFKYVDGGAPAECEDDAEVCAEEYNIDLLIGEIDQCVTEDFSGVIVCEELPEGYEEKEQVGNTVIAKYLREAALTLLENGEFGENAYEIDESEYFSENSDIIVAAVVND